MNKPHYPLRFLARVIVEAATPLAVGNGEGNMLTDCMVATDVNGLPYIPGTSLAGVLRHMCRRNPELDQLFGDAGGKQGEGSRLIITEARMIGVDGHTQDGLRRIDGNDRFYGRYLNLPIRQHVHINSKGVTEKAGKFDGQIVYKGTRFCFELELVTAINDDGTRFMQVLSFLDDSLFRIGGGVHNGFGEMTVVACKTKSLDLRKPEDLAFYAEKSSSLAEAWQGEDLQLETSSKESKTITYMLTLEPADFFLFGSGMGDEDADMTYVKESVVEWDDNELPHFKDDLVLIPATSVKGALAHRTAYRYNQLKQQFADKGGGKAGNDNEAVREIFGYNEPGGDVCHKGRVYLSDVFLDERREHIFPHVAIDRFTGGTIEGALFSEKTVYAKDRFLRLNIVLDTCGIQDKDAITAFEQALKDLCAGLLPLGGGVNRGNGVFTGKMIKKGNTHEETESDNA